MNRRTFLIQTASIAAAAMTSSAACAQGPETTVFLRDVTSALPVPLNYTGLSYELAQLSDPTFFSANNRELVDCFRLLSPNGVLRLGGNTSEFCWFEATPSTTAPKLHVPPGNIAQNWMPHQLFAVTPQAINELAGFLHATGWRLIYGLNFGNSTPERAAEEAAYVASKVGDRIEFFQIGNEPDLYTKPSNGTRPPGWSFSDYVAEWTRFAEAVAQKVPSAHFGGPDVAASSDWVLRFGAQVSGPTASRLIALTGHYYAEGPPNDPKVTTARLLAGNPKIATETQEIVSAARANSRVYRMTEGNSCYRGGKPGMSDAFASALWAGDYMLELASYGCSGVNLHGGRSQFLTAGLGGHTPGMEVAKSPQAVHSGFYSPIQSEPGKPVKAMPIFYGMMLANQFAGNTMLRIDGDLHGVNASVYAARANDRVKVAIFNKDEHAALHLVLRGDFSARSGDLWRLEAPSLDATQNVTLAGAQIDESHQWTSEKVEAVEIRSRVPYIHVPGASGALLLLKP